MGKDSLDNMTRTERIGGKRDSKNTPSKKNKCHVSLIVSTRIKGKNQ